MSDFLQIFTLGRLMLRLDDQPVEGFISRKTEALFLYLVCNPQEYPRELLASLFWSEVSQERAQGNLRTALSNLQDLLASFIQVTRTHVQFNASARFWVDTIELKGVLDRFDGMRGIRARLPRVAAAQLAAALTLYKGDFLAGFNLKDAPGFDEWKRAEQENLRLRVISAYAELIDDAYQRAAYSQGLAFAQRLVQLDPLNEAAHRQLMRLQVGAGQRSAALVQYQVCQRVLATELGVIPSDATQALYEEIRSERFTLPRPPELPPNNLLSPPTPFVARATLAQISALLDDSTCRLLTLVGAGGVGKSRLALQAALERVEDYPEGVYFVSLAAVEFPELVLTRIADALQIELTGQEDPAAALIETLAQRDMLLILDAFEQVLPAADFISALLARAPKVKIVVTSRERLKLQQEWLLPVSGMDFPSNGSHPIADYEAVTLFVQTAQRIRRDFALKSNEPAVKRICQMVEGLPLGIELAAGWLLEMTSAEIVQQIEQDLDLLTTSLRNIPESQRSIRVVFEHSWRLLSSEEQDTLMRLSVFRGGFEFDAAEEIAGGNIAIMERLSAKSLLRQVADGRYDMHDLIRRSALEKLEASPLQAEAREKHYEFYRSLAQAARDKRRTPEEAVTLARTRIEHANICGALEWVLKEQRSEQALLLAQAIWAPWVVLGHLAEGRFYLERALNLPQSESAKPSTADVLSGLGVILWRMGDLAAARHVTEQSAALYRELGLTVNVGRLLNNLAILARTEGDLDAARRYLEEALQLLRDEPDPPVLSGVLNSLGTLYEVQGDLIAAKTAYQESAAIKRGIGDQRGLALVLGGLSHVASKESDYHTARSFLQEALAISQELDAQPTICGIYADFGILDLNEGKLSSAHRYLRQALTVAQACGETLQIIIIAEYFGLLADARGEAELSVQLLEAMAAQRATRSFLMEPMDRSRYEEVLTRHRTMLGEQQVTLLNEQAHQWSLSEATEWCLALPQMH
jgi:predicted ATPase/DNA-binding SARP family transcriptional activator